VVVAVNSIRPVRVGEPAVFKLLKPVAGARKYHPTACGESLVIAGLQLAGRVTLPAFAA
jgi:hypothetical protein